MQGVILAAGQGQRLRDPLGRPKCLQRLGGVPLVHHQINALASAGVDDVVIVVGYQQRQVRESVGAAARFVVNDRFAETNSLYSFLLAADVVDEDVVVMNSDLFFHPELPARLLELDGDALLYDSASGGEDEHMKVQVANGHLVEMSKVMDGARVSGENLGMLHLSAAGVAAAARAGQAIVNTGGERSWLATAINSVAVEHPIRCVDVAGWPWVEIDFPEDLWRARAQVFPSVSDAIDQVELELLGQRELMGVQS
jgi:L-glutamine-phosphate cytidylyltransferase